MDMDLKTKVCDLLGCRYPILVTSFDGMAGEELPVAVTLAGGFGIFGTAIEVANKGPEELVEWLQGIGRLCQGKPFGVDILVSGAEGGLMTQLIDAFADGGAKAFISRKGVPSKSTIDKFHARNMLVGCVCTKVSHSLKAVAVGVDFVIAQGCESGGSTGEIFTSVLVPQIVDAVAGKVPVVAAGGYFEGRGLASALCYGAQGVCVGTRFLLTPEARIPRLHKEKLLQANENDTVVTRCYTGTRLRVLRNGYTKKFENNPKLLEAALENMQKKYWISNMFSSTREEIHDWEDADRPYVVGQSVGGINDLKPAGEIIREMAEAAAATLVEISAKFTKDDGTVSTPLCSLLGTKYCIMSAGMGGIAGKDMTSAVSKAGGFGTFGSALDVANLGPEELLKQIEDINRMCGGTPFGVNILVHGRDGGVMPQLIDAFSKGGARAFISGKGHASKKVVDAFHERKLLVGSICGKVSHAESAVKAGVDFIIVQGSEGGGHTGDVGLSVLLPLVVDAVGDKVPVIAAGGIYDGRGIASALCYGAQGVWVGTRFMMSPEAQTNDEYKARLLKASSDDTCVTKCYTGSTMRVIRNPYVTRFEQDPESVLAKDLGWNSPIWKTSSGQLRDLDKANQALVTGQNIGAINTLKPCADIVRDMNSEAWNVIRSVQMHVRVSSKL